MSDIAGIVQRHYGRSDLLDRIEAALKAAGKDSLHPHYQDLQLVDQLHPRGIQATEEHAARAGIRVGLEVLDLGCGIGGGSRYLAAAAGCRVTAIDLTPEYLEVARVLTARCGLGDAIEFRPGNALALPFPAASFDHVWCHNVTMNIADRATLAREVARVVRPKGRFSCVETAQGPSGPPQFPLPWAVDPAGSALTTPEAMRGALEGAGLRIVEQIDFAAVLEKKGPPPPQLLDTVNGPDYTVRVANAIAGRREGRLVDQFILAEKPGTA
jgi:sarcosine/dimethylglycine N-methyltransferase